MFELVAWIVSFIFVYVCYEMFVVRKERALETMKTSKELDILKKKYRLDYNKLDMKTVARMIGFSNAIIISTVLALVSILRPLLNNMFLWSLSIFVLGMTLIIPMILIRNAIIGTKLARKQGGKNNV